MKTIALTLSILTLLTFSSMARTGNPLERQIVSVRVTSQEWNEYRPWQKMRPTSRTFMGTVVPGNRILMLTDDLADATLIQVQKYDRPPRVPARVVHRDLQIGLAVITVDEPGFFDDLEPVKIAKEIPVGADYYCASWKSGQLSMAECHWSKVTVFNSGMPYFCYPGIKFITDLSGGGWGEPIFSGQQLVGLGTSQSDTRVTVKPAELLNAYLQAVDMETYPGFAWLGINYQHNKGPAQAAWLGQTGKPTGILIRSCFPGGSAEGCLMQNDILLELDGHPIDSLGDYVHPRFGIIDIGLIPSEGHYAGDTIKAKVLRDKKEQTIEILLKNIPPSAALIPRNRQAVPPAYLLAGGFVFRELDDLYLQAWGDDWKQQIPAYLRVVRGMKAQLKSPEQQRLIVLTDVFPDQYNLGYHDMAQNIVKAVNGQPIDSIPKLVEAFKQPKDGFHVIEFMPSYGVSKVILDAENFDAATQRIMQMYQIPSRMRLNEEEKK